MRALLLVGVLAACAVSSAPPSPPRESRIALEVKNATLQNGLRVVLVRDPRATDVQVTMQYKVGAIDDPAGQEGMAHLVEHLMFQQVLGAQTLFARLEDTATAFNATTTEEATTYTSRARPEKLDELLSIEAVRVGFRCTSISQSAFEREREVVRNELRLRDGATQVQEAVYTGVYPTSHPYRRATAGTPESVGKITREQACIFADTFYTTANAVLVVSGDVTPARVDTALNKFLGRVQKRDGLARPVKVPGAPAGLRATVASPFDEELYLFTWPLPADPAEQLKVRASAAVTALAIDTAVRGPISVIDIGGPQAPVLAIVVVPAGPQGDLVQNVRTALEKLEAKGMSSMLFDLLHQEAVNGVFARYETGSDRDDALASRLHAGRDPSRALATDAAALRTLTYDDMRRVLREHLTAKRMGVVQLQPRAGVKQGLPAKVEVPVHDIGQRREVADPAEARQPYAEPLAAPALAGMRKLTLPNGLDVVLLPVTSIPTVEIRLVFDVGTADEPAGRRGTALAAARTLVWPRGYYEDFLNLVAAGASRTVAVTGDSTAFVTRGLDMHVDFLLTGLARWVREGRYLRSGVRALRDVAFEEEAPLEDAWREALYGAAHPYARGDLERHVDPALTVEELAVFRARHYTPKAATLVIAGRFDAQLAEQWVQHLFADWMGGEAPPRTTPAATVQPVSLAADDDLSQTHVRIALPATGSRAVQLVLARMLDQITGDVRHQLGASYSFVTALAAPRVGAVYVLDGRIDATRTQEALELVRTRIAALREDPDAAARAFVAARKRALLQLGGLAASAHELAVRAHADLAHGRPPLSDATTATEVAQLTIDQLTAAIAALDLTRGAIYMRGPAAQIDAAYAALGRTPRRIAKAKRPTTEPPAVFEDEDDDDLDVDDAPPPPGHDVMFGVTVGPGYASANQRSLTGFTIGADAGYRLTRETTVGLHLGFGSATGSYKTSELGPSIDVTARSFQLGGLAQATGYDRLSGALFLGVNVGRVDDLEDTSYVAAYAGLQGGIDVLARGRHRLALYLRLDTEVFSDTSYSMFSLGVGYRHW